MNARAGFTGGRDTLEDLDRNRGEAEDEDQENPRRDELALVVEGLVLVRDGRVADAGEEREGHPHPPARPLQPEDREDDEERQSEDSLEAAEDGVDRVPAVELPQRQEVERRDEEPEPRGQEDRVLDDVDARVGRAREEPLEELDEDRVLEEHGPFRERRRGVDARVRDAPREKRDGHGE